MSWKIIKIGNVVVNGDQKSAYKLENGEVKWFNDKALPVVASKEVAQTFTGHNPNRKGNK